MARLDRHLADLWTFYRECKHTGAQRPDDGRNMSVNTRGKLVYKLAEVMEKHLEELTISMWNEFVEKLARKARAIRVAVGRHKELRHGA